MMIRQVLGIGTIAVVFLCSSATAMNTAFSYQGRLSDEGAPASGDYDFQFILYDAEISGSQVGPVLYGDEIVVSDGYFTLYLDFGPGIFDGTDLWLEVQVRDGAATGSYTPLAPRQSILPSPYSLYSATITWTDINGMPPDFADGVDDDTIYAPGNQLELTGDTFGVVEGPGSGLDADTLDGWDSLEFSPIEHAHSGDQITSGTVAEPRIDAVLARDAEVMSIILAGDGSGSTLDADLLDGLSATAFAPMEHIHWTVGDGLNLDGDELSVDPTDFNGTTPINSSSSSGTITASTYDQWQSVNAISFSPPAHGHLMAMMYGTLKCSFGCSGAEPGVVYVGIDKDASPYNYYRQEFTEVGIDRPINAFDEFLVSEGVAVTIRASIKPMSSGDQFTASYTRVAYIFIPD